MTRRHEEESHLIVIAGLDPAIHADIARAAPWMRGSSPRMTVFLLYLLRAFVSL
jgi:hypothetical protein